MCYIFEKEMVQQPQKQQSKVKYKDKALRHYGTVAVRHGMARRQYGITALRHSRTTALIIGIIGIIKVIKISKVSGATYISDVVFWNILHLY